MSVVASIKRPEDVGEILVKVQEDLQQLREQIIAQDPAVAGETQLIDLNLLHEAIQKTEDGIKSKAELVVQQLNNQVQTLPNLDQRFNGEGSGYKTAGPEPGGRAPTYGGNTQLQTYTGNRDVPQPPRHQPLLLRRMQAHPTASQPKIQTQGPTPGQSFKHEMNTYIAHDAHNAKNREVLHDNYGIQLPLIETRTAKPSPNKAMYGSTVEPLAILAKENRADPQLLPPAITEKDARHGILSLIQRGLIPPAAELTLDPSPVYHSTAKLHNPKDKENKGGDLSYNFGSYKLDPALKSREGQGGMTAPAPSPTKSSVLPKGVQAAPADNNNVGVSKRSQGKLKTPVPVKTLEMAVQPMPPPTTPASGQDLKDKYHRFAVQHGRVRDNTHEFMVFKQHYCLSWGSIVTMLRQIEKMLTLYAVPIAFVNGDKLADLSIEFELETMPGIPEMLSVIVNREDVEKLIFTPGQRFQGPMGHYLAASKIQATYRMHLARKGYLDWRKKKWAAGVIAISWIMNVKIAKVRKQLNDSRLDQLEGFRRRGRLLSKNWSRLKESRRVIIHLPSCGFSENVRGTITDFALWQNMQMARLCDIRDPNVDVIYISPVHLNEEMLQYYAKLLGLKSAIDSGEVGNQSDYTSRYTIITPESVNSFPSHNMCLSTHLKYSPDTLKRIHNLIAGRDAYIIPGIPHIDDIYVADYLDVPLLGPDPKIAHLYSTKSGSKRIFGSANVTVPPGEYDIYSLPQLHECLAQLVTENLEVTRWLLKLDDQWDGKGIAYIDIAEHLRCYPWALKEAQRYGEKWSKKWAQEAAYIKIHAELPDVLANHAKPVNYQVYNTWQKYLNAFLSQGGVIEACPPSDSVQGVTVDMMIEPDGTAQIVNLGDQIHAETPFCCWGLSVPQSSVEPEQLNQICSQVAQACKARHIVGHFTVDFVTFIHPKTMQQELWAVDLSLHYSDTLAMYRLLQFSTGGQLNPETHYFNVQPAKREEKKSRRKKLKEEPEIPENTNRFAVMSTRMRHTNLSVVHYSVFFQMCRAHGIGYDIKEKQGTVFTLVDSSNRENVGMITMGGDLQSALATFARNLNVIHQEISAPNMQGKSNFKPVIEDIEAIIGTANENGSEGDDYSSEVTEVE